ncbi:4-(cytidine 5'-diphospho)-2-C-methyl-D-erythritol kinase [Longimicrobium sp.]|uniref:4-(cytidine 5'-diphospho)-2-C-methyl-D-erythritol kinase n=1 Tax=Longimicrobium sp. TaxID=2029185 RepID=UPI002C79D0C9|nr:4-(cytidine 5'-diphospho)-2-C-methyl-D-erythritol kinase [Longimicrobium sp.]HSU15244.1 4-(cytidine 5'-diphospho)-2-C-methyl-D-erythritol kinase [Longimicrobium sp.]
MPDRVAVAAPAKVNLRLCILAREESGYHALETVFCALSLADRVSVARGDAGIRLEMEGGVDAGPPERNLAVRAADRFHREIGESPAIDLHLAKRIPAAAGLGGGSSDAAAVLRALNALHGEAVSREALLQMGIELGADVPFFLCGSPLALAWGRGERLMPLPPLPPRPVLVAHPGEAMPTPEAFREVAALRGGSYAPRATLLDPSALASWDAVAALATNDFEPVVTARIPILRGALEMLRASGARIALLAGSGSSIFAIFDDSAARDAAEKQISALGLTTWRAETLGEMPRPTTG